MEFNIEKLADAEMRTVGKMDAEDMAAMKICLLSAGALAGLSVKNKFFRRLTGLACTVLAVGLAVPLASRYLEELRNGEDDPTPLVDADPFAATSPESGAAPGDVVREDIAPEQ